jgi:hypothetical protein
MAAHASATARVESDRVRATPAVIPTCPKSVTKRYSRTPVPPMEIGSRLAKVMKGTMSAIQYHSTVESSGSDSA